MNSVEIDYYTIINDFVTGKISADIFKKVYSDKYLNDNREYSNELFHILDRIYAEVDLYTKDESLLKNFDFYIDKDALFEGAQKALEKINLLIDEN